MPAKEIPNVNPMKRERPGKDRGKTGERPGKDYSDRVAIYMDVIRPPFLS